MDKIIENKKLSSMLSDPSLLKDKAFIAGEWVNSTNGDTFELIEIWSNPIFKAIFSINSSCFLNL